MFTFGVSFTMDTILFTLETPSSLEMSQFIFITDSRCFEITRAYGDELGVRKFLLVIHRAEVYVYPVPLLTYSTLTIGLTLKSVLRVVQGH